jgi:hypothetical protein
MTELDPSQLPGEAMGLSRRTMLRMGAAGAITAWTVPVIVTLQASPAGAASPPPSTGSSAPVQPPPVVVPEPIAPITPPSGGEVEPDVVVNPTPPPEAPGVVRSETTAPETTAGTSPQIRGEAVEQPVTTTPSGGLAFTGAEIGGLVVLGTGAVALGTAAVWSARHREDDDEGSPAS